MDEWDAWRDDGTIDEWIDGWIGWDEMKWNGMGWDRMG